MEADSDSRLCWRETLPVVLPAAELNCVFQKTTRFSIGFLFNRRFECDAPAGLEVKKSQGQWQ